MSSIDANPVLDPQVDQNSTIEEEEKRQESRAPSDSSPGKERPTASEETPGQNDKQTSELAPEALPHDNVEASSAEPGIDRSETVSDQVAATFEPTTPTTSTSGQPPEQDLERNTSQDIRRNLEEIPESDGTPTPSNDIPEPASELTRAPEDQGPEQVSEPSSPAASEKACEDASQQSEKSPTGDADGETESKLENALGHDTSEKSTQNAVDNGSIQDSADDADDVSEGASDKASGKSSENDSETELDSPVPRTSMEKKPIKSLAAVDRLPDEIIEQILQVADPDSFASLVLLNTTWRRVSQQAHLYAHHLEKCPSYSASHNTVPSSSNDGSDSDDDERKLDEMRKSFAREVKRNLFEAYLRPSETTITLISNSISSSSCPGGEGMQFSPSPRGHHLLAYNSSRIYVIDVRIEPIEVTRELKILRRPVSTCIKDDGSVLAVLSSEMQVDLYDLEQSPPKRTQSMILDHAPRTIAMSPCGSVLAAAYEGGIEVTSLSSYALPTDRRAVKCDAVDSLTFSFDGTQLLGTTVQSSPPNTVVLTAPYYDPSNIVDNDMSALWTTSILFPNTSRDCSHAVLLQDTSQEEASWTFTYDRSFETFRAVRIDDLRNGTTYFTGPIPSPCDQAKLLPCTSPAATYHGDLVAAGFKGKDVWIYGVPEDLDAVPDFGPPAAENGLAALARRNSEIPSRTPSARAPESSTRPQWQQLCDKLRNTFVWGTKVAELDGVSTVKWVSGFGSSTKERLIIAARGVTPPKPITEQDDIDFIDGGRITILDFDYRIEDGVKTEITIEVGTKEPEALEEEQRDMATEVAIVRRRTVAQKRGDRNGLLRAATTAGARATPPVPDVPSLPTTQTMPTNVRADTDEDDDDPLVPRRIGALPQTEARPVTSAGVRDESESSSLLEAQEAVDLPYAHDGPRSANTLRRAATAAAANRRRQPEPAVAGQVEYRRADGRREHPHESDADNWVPPPPPYQKEDPGDLPAFLRQPTAQSGVHSEPLVPIPRFQTAAPTVGSSTWAAPPLPAPPVAPGLASPHRRTASDGTVGSRLQGDDLTRPTTSVSVQASSNGQPRAEDGDIYDVSPPDSPRLGAQALGNNARPMQNSGYPDAADFAASRQSSFAAQTPPQPPPQPRSRVPSMASIGPSHFNVPYASEARPQPPSLDLQIPSPAFVAGLNFHNHAQASPVTGDSASGRRISNAPTWPNPPSVRGHGYAMSWDGHPRTAPPIGASANEIIAATFPPPHMPDARSSIGSRGSASHSSIQRVPVGGRGLSYSPAGFGPLPHNVPLPHTPVPMQSPHMVDQPLIISTPSGVSGAFDPPPAHARAGSRSETPILAPIPRHPRPTTSAGRPTDRIDPSYIPPPPPIPQGRSTPRSLLPSWLSAPSTTSVNRTHSIVNRRPSRAERSAAKNMQDAKRRGWSGTRRGRKKKQAEQDAVSIAGWTDVSAVNRGHHQQQPNKKDKKCVVM